MKGLSMEVIIVHYMVIALDSEQKGMSSHRAEVHSKPIQWNKGTSEKWDAQVESTLYFPQADGVPDREETILEKRNPGKTFVV